jgi:hypothetical protein
MSNIEYRISKVNLVDSAIRVSPVHDARFAIPRCAFRHSTMRVPPFHDARFAIPHSSFREFRILHSEF